MTAERMTVQVHFRSENKYVGVDGWPATIGEISDLFSVTRALEPLSNRYTVTHLPTGLNIPIYERSRRKAILRAEEKLREVGIERYTKAVENALLTMENARRKTKLFA